MRKHTLFFLFAIFLSQHLFASIKIWTGASNSSWNTAANWSGGLPVNGDDVLIDAANYANEPIISSNSNFSVNDITIQNGGKLTVNASVIVAGNISVVSTATLTASDNAAGIIYFNGNTGLLGNGTFIFPSIIINSGKILNQSEPASICVKGSWTNNEGFFIPNTNKVVFCGTVVQYLKGTSQSQSFYDFEVAKTSQSLRTDGSLSLLYVHDFIQTSYKFVDSSLSEFHVSGNFTHTSGTFVPCNNIFISGNVYENYASNSQSDLTWGNCVTLDGSSTQYIGGVHAINSFYTLVIKNSSNSGIVLQQPVNIETALTLIDGIIYSNAANMVIIKDNATSSQGSDSSFVDGPVQKIGNDPFVFPVGSAGNWARLEMINDVSFKNYSATTKFTCTYYKSASPNCNSLSNLPSGIKYASGTEYWDLERTNDPGNDAQCNVRLYWEDTSKSGISDLTDLKLVHLSSHSNLYEDKGGMPIADGKSGYISSTIPFTNFSPITFGSGDGVNPLPINLLSFNAKVIADKVELKWRVASELNNDYYTIERSMDGVLFNEVVRVKGLGTSTVSYEYSAVDLSPPSGNLYYRLKQTDFDGKSKTYKAIHANISDQKESLVLYPNPLNACDELYLQTNFTVPVNLTLEFYSCSGKCINSINLKSDKGLRAIKMFDKNQNILPSGVYQVLIKNEEHILSVSRIIVR